MRCNMGVGSGKVDVAVTVGVTVVTAVGPGVPGVAVAGVGVAVVPVCSGEALRVRPKWLIEARPWVISPYKALDERGCERAGDDAKVWMVPLTSNSTAAERVAKVFTRNLSVHWGVGSAPYSFVVKGAAECRSGTGVCLHDGNTVLCAFRAVAR